MDLHVKKRLDFWVKKRNDLAELSRFASPDPIQVAHKYKDEFVSLICALFAYGNAKAIVKFLNSLDFSILEKDEKTIRKSLKDKVYRFETSEDIMQFFIALSRIKKINSLEKIFLNSYQINHNVMDGINALIDKIYEQSSYSSRGYTFLIGKRFTCKTSSTYKRWNMYLRWMVRSDEVDLGLWKKVNKADLLAPLDTHTHKMAIKLGLIQRKTYDFKSCLELTETFKTFDLNDPIKYDFALYRLGQEKIQI